MLATETTTSLGPAVVLGAEGRRLQLVFEEETVWADNALAFPYQPAEGDVVLATGREGAFYVIGLLQPKGEVTLHFPGDVRFSAAQGRIVFDSGRGLELNAPQIRVHSGKFELFAETLVERLGNVYRKVKGLLQTCAGRRRTVVEGTSYEQAERAVLLADKDVKIDGEKIHLG